MESQTRNLLRECSTGCKMAINSFNQMRDYVEDEKLKELMNTYDKKHKEYEEQAGKMLKEGRERAGRYGFCLFPTFYGCETAYER